MGESFTKFPNKILEKTMSSRITGECNQILNTILRKTYGFQKEWAYITIGTFTTITGMDRIAVSKNIKKMVDDKIILRNKGTGGWVYKVNENVDEWVSGKSKKDCYFYVPKNGVVYLKELLNG